MGRRPSTVSQGSQLHYLRSLMSPTGSNRPLLFACSGCSNAGAAADQVARLLNAAGVGEMSCLAGVAARKKPFLQKLSDREVWVIDGCPIHCAGGVFEQLEGVEPGPIRHIKLHEAGLKKQTPPPDEGELARLCAFAVAVASSDRSSHCEASNSYRCSQES